MRWHRRSVRTGAAALLVLTGAAGCVHRTMTTEIVDVTPDAAQDQRLKPASNLPVVFEIVTPARLEGDCPSRLRDPELQALLTLSHSMMLPVRDTAAAGGRTYTAYGDYAIQPQGSYGDEPGHGLRIECGRLRAIGIVQLIRE
jgi:hypothetical protein